MAKKSKSPYPRSSQSKSSGYYGSYGRKNARTEAVESGLPTYSTDGGTRIYDTKSSSLIRNEKIGFGGKSTPNISNTSSGEVAGASIGPEGEGSGGYYLRSDPNAKLRGIVDDLGEEPNLDAIRSELEKSNQGLIDAISSQYAGTIAEERKAGDIRNQRGRAINIASGLGGSDFGSARADEIETQNRGAIQAIEDERNSKINSILAGVATKASERYKEEKDAYTKKAEDILSRQEEYAKSALEDAKNLASYGLTADKIKTEDPDSWQKLMDSTGYGDEALTAFFAAQIPEKKKVFQQKVGNTMVIGYEDPLTKTIKTEKVKIADGFSDFKVIDGKPYFIDEEKEIIKLAAGFTPGKGKYTGSDKFADQDTASYFNTLPKAFKDSWTYNYGIYGNPKYRTTYDDLQADYKEWAANNSYADIQTTGKKKATTSFDDLFAE